MQARLDTKWRRFVRSSSYDSQLSDKEMEPATIARLVSSILGLFPLCVSGYNTVKSAFMLKKDVQSLMADNTIQSGVRLLIPSFGRIN